MRPTQRNELSGRAGNERTLAPKERSSQPLDEFSVSTEIRGRVTKYDKYKQVQTER